MYIPLPPEAYEELKKIYREEYGKELSDEEVVRMGTILIELFKIITPTKKVPLKRKKLRKK